MGSVATETTITTTESMTEMAERMSKELRTEMHNAEVQLSHWVAEREQRLADIQVSLGHPAKRAANRRCIGIAGGRCVAVGSYQCKANCCVYFGAAHGVESTQQHGRQFPAIGGHTGRATSKQAANTALLPPSRWRMVSSLVHLSSASCCTYQNLRVEHPAAGCTSERHNNSSRRAATPKQAVPVCTQYHMYIRTARM